jgi:hypothetical protein
MAINNLIVSWVLYFSLFQYTEADFVGKYSMCSVGCIHVDVIFIESNHLVFSTARTDRTDGYKPEPRQVGKWLVSNDSVILLRMVKSKVQIELSYILKVHSGISFLIPPSEEVNWFLTEQKFDSAFQNSYEFYAFSFRKNWKSTIEKEKVLREYKRNVYSRVLYWNEPVKKIYIKEE